MMNTEQFAQGGSDRDMPPSPDPAINPDRPTVPDPDDDPLMNEEEGGGRQEADDVPDDARQSVEQPYEFKGIRRPS